MGSYCVDILHPWDHVVIMLIIKKKKHVPTIKKKKKKKKLNHDIFLTLTASQPGKFLDSVLWNNNTIIDNNVST